MAESIQTTFVFPGEGAYVFGILVTPDMEHGYYPHDQLVGSPAYQKRLEDEKAAGAPDV
jgi:hypothetical protein